MSESVNKLRTLANMCRELGDLYDELCDIEENDELDAQNKNEAQEQILGRIIVKSLMAQKLSN